MGQDECGAGDVSDFAGACGDVLESAPAAGEQGKPAFAQATQGALNGIAGAGIDVEFPAAGWLLDRDEDAQAGAVVAGIGKVGRSAAAARYSPGRAWMRAAVMSCTEPDSTSETHSGNPLGAMTAWMLPP
jgi:hypothetical protein